MKLFDTAWLVSYLVGWLGVFLVAAHISLGWFLWGGAVIALLILFAPTIRDLWRMYYYYLLTLHDD